VPGAGRIPPEATDTERKIVYQRQQIPYKYTYMAGNPTLSVVVGAGGSLELGAPSTNALTTIIHAALDQMPALPKSSPGWAQQVSKVLITRCQEYYGSHYNFEFLFNTLEAITSLSRSWDHQTVPEYKIAEAMFCKLADQNKYEKLFDLYFTICAQRRLLEAIHTTMSNVSTSAAQHANWDSYSNFWNSLTSNFNLKIATLNYDTLVDQALGVSREQQGFVPIPGESVARFDEGTLEQHGRLMHLHGSIHFGYRTGDSKRFIFEEAFDDLYWHDTSSAALASQTGKSTNTNQAGREAIISPIITGLQKPDKLLYEPFSTYYRTLGHLLRSNNKLLVVGYGFSDIHINALLSRMTRWHGPNRKIALITWFDSKDWSPSMDWALNRGNEFQTVATWTEDRAPMNHSTYQNPWTSSNGLVRVYLGGLMDTATNLLPDLVSFFS